MAWEHEADARPPASPVTDRSAVPATEPSVPRPAAGHDDELTVVRRRPTAAPDERDAERTVVSPHARPPTAAPPAAPTAWRLHDRTTTPPWSASFGAGVPVERFVAPPPAVVRTRRRLPTGRLLAAVAAIVALGVLLGVAWVSWLRPVRQDPATKVDDHGSAPAVSVARGDEVVRRYLQALADGDAATAISLGADQGQGSRDLVTGDAFTTASGAARVSNVQVPQVAANATSIPARYDLGGTPVQTTFTVVRRDDLSWQLTRSVETVRFSSPSGARVPLLVNGHRVRLDSPYTLLPGSYRVTTGLPFLAYGPDDDLRISDLSGPAASTHTVGVQLTDKGSIAMAQATRRGLDSCIAATVVAPSGCPFARSLPRGATASSVRWSFTTDPMTTVTGVQLDPHDLSVGQLRVTIATTMSATITLPGGRTEKSPANAHTGTSLVTMSLLATTAIALTPTFGATA